MTWMIAWRTADVLEKKHKAEEASKAEGKKKKNL